jgi:peptide/nickel transport system substrate-binding protein
VNATGTDATAQTGLPRRTVLRGGALLGLGTAAGAFTGCASDRPDRQVSGTDLRPPRRGGVLRVGVTGGSTKDTLDPHDPPTYPDQARVSNLFEPLFLRDPSYAVQPVLAESLESSRDASTWTLRLRQGVEFHNGKTLDADDVAFTLWRILEPATGITATPSLSMVDVAGLRKLDARTLVIPLKQPYALFKDQLAQYYLGIVPVGFDITRPVGTGPFRFGSFTPGQSSRFPRFDKYWRTDQPYVDELVIIDFPDDRKRVQALLDGQVDAIDNLPQTKIDTVKAVGVNVLISETGAWTPFTMRVDAEPFRDVRVREAMRLIVDREQMVSQALNGQGRIANDLYAPFDIAYARDLPQRQQDLPQAMSLLKRAGHEHLQVELVTSSGIGAGAVEAAGLFAKQAQGAGVDIRVREVDAGVFYGQNYRQWAFALDYWFTRSYLPQVFLGSQPDSQYNECHWNDEKFNALVNQARGELDAARRIQLLREAQKIEYDSGGYIVWGFKNQVDAYSAKVTGFVSDRNLPLSSFQFRIVSFA